MIESLPEQSNLRVNDLISGGGGRLGAPPPGIGAPAPAAAAAPVVSAEVHLNSNQVPTVKLTPREDLEAEIARPPPMAPVERPPTAGTQSSAASSSPWDSRAMG